MKKIRVIDLLNKIANAEIPKKIKIDGKIFEWIVRSPSEEGYVNKSSGLNTWLCHDYNIDDIGDLNIEVEIIEEDKKIEKLDIHQEKNCKNNWKWKCNGYNISTPQKIIGEKLNEVIDKLNEMSDDV